MLTLFGRYEAVTRKVFGRGPTKDPQAESHDREGRVAGAWRMGEG